MTIEEAFTDFWEHLHQTGAWDAIPLKERTVLHVAHAAAKRGTLGPRRAARLFDQYMPGRYAVKTAVLLLV